MAQVYLAHHEGLGRTVAVKRLRRHLAGLEEARDRLRNEADIARQLRHEHIVNVLDLVTDPDGDAYLVMEHVSGEPLSARLARGGALPLSEALSVGLQVSAALEAVHRRGIVHRDLKTENVLVGLKPDGSLLAKLIDFGVAEILGSRDPSESNMLVGTPESMAPEQAMAGTTDRRSDIYSFGVLLYEMVAGVPPFQGNDLHSLLERVVSETPLPASQRSGAQKQLIPIALDRLILDCLAKSPHQRPQHMSEVRARLEAIAAEYQSLTEAVERAIERTMNRAEARPDRFVNGAGVVVEQDIDRPMAARSPVRAVGTSEGAQIPVRRPVAPGLRAVASAAAPAPIQKVQWSPPAERHAADDDGDQRRASESRMCHGVARIVRMGFFMAVLAAGGFGLASTLSSSSQSPDEVSSPWPYLPTGLGR